VPSSQTKTRGRGTNGHCRLVVHVIGQRLTWQPPEGSWDDLSKIWGSTKSSRTNICIVTARDVISKFLCQRAMLIQIHKECQCRVSMTGQCQNPQCLGANQATDACQSVIKLSWLGYCTKRFTKDTWHMESSDTHKNAIASAHNRWEQVKQNPLKNERTCNCSQQPCRDHQDPT